MQSILRNNKLKNNKFFKIIDRSFSRKGGFSLLELMLVMSIIAILSIGVAVWFLGYQRQVEVDSAAGMIVSALQDARSRSVSGKDFKPWGVCFDSINNKFILFRDDGVACADATSKEENYLSPYVRISMLCPATGVCLNGGGSTIIFSNLGGGTAQYGTANGNNTAIRIEQAGNTPIFKDITVTSSGKIDTL